MKNKFVEYFSRISPLSEEEAKGIEDGMCIKTFKKGTVLLKEGQLSVDTYFILEGCIREFIVIEEKLGQMINSDFLNGLEVVDAIEKILGEIEKQNIGKAEVQFKMRDANFSRQRYWGEPFPIIYTSDDIPVALTEEDLPVETPWIDSIQAGIQGQSPLVHATEWVNAIPITIKAAFSKNGYFSISFTKLCATNRIARMPIKTPIQIR